jgi:hypothetical protein
MVKTKAGDKWLITLVVGSGASVHAADRWSDVIDPGDVPAVAAEVDLRVRVSAFSVRGRPVARLEWGAEPGAESF